ncbi:MAG: hemolysin III family protein [Spirochaetes bacterium]|nr:MAG: hemolysin III family protein [Spirochaetota bacterium]
MLPGRIRVKDPFSGFSHLFGALLSIAGLAALITNVSGNRDAYHVVSVFVYGISMVLFYLLIAGTYTPYCLIPLRGPWGWSIVGVVWAMAILGIVFKLFFLQAPRWVSTGIYLVMGWVCLAAIYPMIKKIPPGGMFFLALGGIFYSVGAVIYARKKPDPFTGVFGFHEIWHLFVLAGSIAHFISIYRYILVLP